ncbi:Hypothetical protein, putative [Bodo saltans]|uniref:Uncharacterized protein n=1 Tax=Bodo saltans TaxID=75058 RepID=A0A0S4J485_BODSA|nr:Hypothetical protein, putative [Bodo saltans]|eukprot:CUG14059.1 Hypothetical protein, putative [Bodo saltans]
MGAATPLSLYQASFRGRHAAPSPDLLDDSPPPVASTAQQLQQKQQQQQKDKRKVAIKSRSLNLNPRHAVTTRHQTLTELLQDNRRAVESCTPQFKAKHLRHTPPLPTPSLLPQSKSSPAVTTSPTSPVVMFGVGGGEILPAPSSTYRESFIPDPSRASATLTAAGKMLPRDPVDSSAKPLTETTLSRASYQRYGVTEYQQRQLNVSKSHDAVLKRFEEATEYARRQTPATGSNGGGGAPSLQSLHQASFVAPPVALTPPPRRNPELIQAAASVKERERAGYFNMEITSTQRGDYSVAPQMKKRCAAAAESGQKATTMRATHEELKRPSSSLVASCAPLRYVVDTRASSSMAQEQFPPHVLSRALDAMSTELADPPAYRSQSSCEIINQRNSQFPGASIHSPVAQCSGPDVINRRCALDAEHKHRAAGFSLRPHDAPKPTMHTCSEIFGTAPAVTGLSLSQASYRPFQFL